MHALVVGGTGMLAGVSLTLATRGAVVSVVGRTAAKHGALRQRAEGLSGVIHPLQLDYRYGDALEAALRQAVAAHGPIGTAVCWIHRTAPDAHRQIATELTAVGGSCRYTDVLGSTAAGPFAQERGAWLRAQPGLTYRQVLLGCMPQETGWRWLTDAEISAGVLAALDSDAESYQVGSPVPGE